MWSRGNHHHGLNGSASDEQGDAGWNDFTPGFYNPMPHNFRNFASNAMSFGPTFSAFGSQSMNMQPNQLLADNDTSSPLAGVLAAGGHTGATKASPSQTIPARASSANNGSLILDQRAAELKEMLLKNRKDRVNSASSAQARRNSNIISQDVSKTNKSNSRNTQLSRTNPLLTNQGDVDDVAELISSVRESATKEADNDSSGNTDIAVPKAAAKPLLNVCPAAEFTTSQQATSSKSDARSKSAGKEKVNGEKRVAKEPPNAPVADVEEGEIVKETAPHTNTVEIASSKPSGRSLPAKPPPVSKSNPTPSLSSRQEGVDNRQASRLLALWRMEETKTAKKPSDDGRKKAPGPPDHRVPSLERQIEQDKDLRDWLLMTEYHDVAMRTKRLARFRQKQELDAKMQSIQLAMKKLDEEEELEMKGKRPATVGIVKQSQENADDATKSNGTGVGVATAGSTNGSTNTSVASARNGNTPAKRECEGDQYRVNRQEKMPRLDKGPERHDTLARTDAQRSRPGLSRGADPSRQSAATHTFAGPYPYNSYDRQQHPRSYPHTSAARGGHRYPDDWPRGRDVGPNKPSFINLGHKGESRFFIVKSFNEENVRRCMDDGIWTTQVDNGRVLADAFVECKNVILFFSINKSRAFQGVARMETRPSPDIPKPRWMDAIHWETSQPFRVDWLSRTEVEFRRIGHLKNAYNENSAVLVGKDGQEIEDECGRDLFHEMMVVAMERRGLTPSDGDDPRRRSRSPRFSYRRGAGYAGRGDWRGGRGRVGSYVKRERDMSHDRDLP